MCGFPATAEHSLVIPGRKRCDRLGFAQLRPLEAVVGVTWANHECATPISDKKPFQPAGIDHSCAGGCGDHCEVHLVDPRGYRSDRPVLPRARVHAEGSQTQSRARPSQRGDRRPCRPTAPVGPSGRRPRHLRARMCETHVSGRSSVKPPSRSPQNSSVASRSAP